MIHILFFSILFSSVFGMNFLQYGTYRWTNQRFQNISSTYPTFWTSDLVRIDPLHPNTVMMFGKMNQNAYEPSDSDDWLDVPGYDLEDPIGWTGNTIRGHIFGSEDNSTFILVIKGTSLYGETSSNDKLMDNMMFGCCFGCVASTNVCNQTCLLDKLFGNVSLSYVNLARYFYLDLRTMYPNAEIWFSGHSLGGAIANILGIQEHIPSLSFNAPGDRLYASRAGLRLENVKVWNYGNTADPIFNGQCGSLCWLGGYKLESKCHLGNICSYDLSNLWSVNYHRIDTMVNSVILKYPIPVCDASSLCQDCSEWKFDD